MGGDLHELAGADLIEPDLRHAGAVARVLVHHDAPQQVDGHVVEHAVALVALQEDLDRATALRPLDVVEVQVPEPAVGGEAGGGDEVVVVAPAPRGSHAPSSGR